MEKQITQNNTPTDIYSCIGILIFNENYQVLLNRHEIKLNVFLS